MKLRRPRPTREGPTAPPALDPNDPALQDDLELACLDAIRGDPPGTAVERRLEHACRAVLSRWGVTNAGIDATSNRRGTHVRIRLPRPGDTVHEVVLQVG